jgi:spore germination protein KA
MIVVSGALGFFGFFAAIAASLVMLCAKTSFGTPYLSPFAPLDIQGLSDFILTFPIWAMKRAPIAITRKMIERTKGKRK